jgi:hypothetical protein
MAGTEPVWVLDTSGLIRLRSEVSKEQRSLVERELTRLVNTGRLLFVVQSVKELQRYQGTDNPARIWAEQNQGTGAARQPSLDTVKHVLAQVPEVLDTDKVGEEEADPYILAIALELKSEGADARIVTNESRTTGPKMPLASAAGYLNIASVSLRTMLKFERIITY